MPPVLSIPRGILEEMVKAARSSEIEVCGLLLGRREDEAFSVQEARFITNRLNSPTEFEMEPVEMAEAIDEAEEKGLEVVGIFHSHLKCPPRPSGRDLEGMELWPVVWLIVTPKGEMMAWILSDTGIKRVTVEHR